LLKSLHAVAFLTHDLSITIFSPQKISCIAINVRKSTSFFHSEIPQEEK